MPQIIQDWVIQEEMFIVIVGAYMRGKSRFVLKPILFKIPRVAAPAPAKVKGPRKRPSGARMAKAIQITRAELGITPPRSALK